MLSDICLINMHISIFHGIIPLYGNIFVFFTPSLITKHAQKINNSVPSRKRHPGLSCDVYVCLNNPSNFPVTSFMLISPA